MIKKLFAVIVLLSIAGFAIADTLNPTSYQGVRRPEIVNTLFTATASMVAGSVIDLGISLGKHYCHIATSGAVASTYMVRVMGGLENKATGLAVIASHSYLSYSSTANPPDFVIVNTPVRYIQGYYWDTATASAVNTTVLKCLSIQE
jgi:hypothetical protein